MRKTISSIRTTILESPGWKTFFSVVIPIVVGVLSGIFVTEISTNEGLDWSLFYKAKSFYGLIVVSIVVCAYYRAVFLYEKNVEKFVDD